jgi:hypothetical protein
MADPFAPPPPPPQTVVVEKKRGGPGCLGCGCGILLLIIVLGGGLMAGGMYYLAQKSAALTSNQAAAVPNFDGGDDVYNSANQKIAAFSQNNRNGQAAKLELTADEINTLIARNPDLKASQVHLFVTLNDSRIQLQASVPAGLIPLVPGGMLKDRFLNATLDFTPGFDGDTKSFDITLHRLRVGDSDVSADNLASMQSTFNTIVETEIQQNPDAKQFFGHVDEISVKDNTLVIETTAD